MLKYSKITVWISSYKYIKVLKGFESLKAPTYSNFLFKLKCCYLTIYFWKTPYFTVHHSHLRDTFVDHGSRVEAFWMRSGIMPDDRMVKGYFPKLIETWSFAPNFCFVELKTSNFGCLLFFFISFNCAKFRQDLTTLIWDIL